MTQKCEWELFMNSLLDDPKPQFYNQITKFVQRKNYLILKSEMIYTYSTCVCLYTHIPVSQVD